MQMRAAWPPFVKSRKSLLVMKGFLLPKFITQMKKASFGAPCLKISRYAKVRKMPRENQALRDSHFLLGLMLQENTD